ncbi:MAG: alanine--tRNA ligase [Nanoarchaeota archaeon]|nr:alanine--tRNA ligase [Nanoarchaeota archaeon]
MNWTRKKLIKEYIDFFKKHGHKEIPNASLVPQDNSTSLFIGSGMETIIPYLLGQRHPLGNRLVNVQKCIRTVDIEETGDKSHGTFFEMLGNWSLGDYWKEEAIKFTFKFHTEILKIPIENYAVTVFSGSESRRVQQDDESIKIWLSLGIPKERIALLRDNLWGPVGNSGPCGPDTEIFYWTGEGKAPKKYDPNDERWVEIGNDVLMQYNKTHSGEFEPLKQKNIDFGGGMERTLAAVNKLDDVFETEVYLPIIRRIEELSGKTYGKEENVTRSMKIVADHIKASVMIIADEIKPSNSEQGYVLRRLIRRAVRYGRELEMRNFVSKIAEPIFTIYDDYNRLEERKEEILEELKKEEERFSQTLEKGENQLIKKIKEIKPSAFGLKGKDKGEVSGEDAFLMYQSYGFPIELVEETAQKYGLKVDKKSFNKELSKHQALSKTSSAGKFKSGLADNSEKTTKLHTATHLLNEALRRVIDKDIKQKGSNITSERLRFDFNFPRKLTEEEKKKIEDFVNKKISENLEVKKEELPLKKALTSGAQSEFGARYPEIVSVYSLGDFSKEICTGPHVKNTKQIGHFKIIKEESAAAGIRRIKATVED